VVRNSSRFSLIWTLALLEHAATKLMPHMPLTPNWSMWMLGRGGDMLLLKRPSRVSTISDLKNQRHR